jgi:hypothetical protein
MIASWILVTGGMIAAIAGVKFVAPLLLLAAVGLYLNGRFGLLIRAWHANDAWGDWPGLNRRWNWLFSIRLQTRIDVVTICVAIVATVLIVLYSDLSY